MGYRDLCDRSIKLTPKLSTYLIEQVQHNCSTINQWQFRVFAYFLIISNHWRLKLLVCCGV
ncbi:hypothetical protein T4B_7954 [Trichinella pseudospiralis]|uniref:Uncharacterized protein n=1 Tax=Trichinella pseudospiralis TaxID=6337 RepID=A0A0V1I9M8_TRIPS|nr:hypothetical protein T4B_7954 [Trichinella pseudospiralis]